MGNFTPPFVLCQILYFAIHFETVLLTNESLEFMDLKIHAFLWSSGLFFKVVKKLVILKLTTVVLILIGFPMSVLKYLSVALILT